MSGSSEKLLIALYSGAVVASDAISESFRLKLRIIDDWARKGVPVRAIGYTQTTDQDDPRVVTLASCFELATHPLFHVADVHIFEFGIYYDLFNAIFLLPVNRCLAVYHNVTPAELVADPELAALLERSLEQRYNMFRADRVFCTSSFNATDLHRIGIASDRTVELPLPPARRAIGRPHRLLPRVEILFVGRVVSAKGIFDLLQAGRQLAAGGQDFRLTIAGNVVFSERSTLEAVRAEVAMSTWLRLIESPSDRALDELYADADVFVMPSFHEGYCVPVFEALEAGCQIVGYDAGNIPAAVNGLGQIVAAGDWRGFAAAIARAVACARNLSAGIATTSGIVEYCAWRAAVREHLDAHSHTQYERTFRREVQAMIQAQKSSRRQVRA